MPAEWPPRCKDSVTRGLRASFGSQVTPTMWSQLNLRETQKLLPLEIEAAPPVTAEEQPPKTVDTPTDNAGKKHRETRVILGAALLMILWYLDTSALKFLNVSQETYGIFWPRRGWLYAHVVAGILAILIGPAQFWPGLKQTYPRLHRVMGVIYVASVGAGGI